MRFAGSKGHFTITVYKSVWPGSSGPQYKFVTVMAGVATLEQTHLSAVDVVSIPSSSGNLRDGVDGGKVLSRDIFGGRSGSHTTVKMRESLMIGDSWEADITGANGIGMHQAYYNVSGRADFPFRPTYLVTDLKELMELL